MICDSCKNQEAQYHSIKIKNGVKTERHLCGKCQSKASYRATIEKGLTELLSGYPTFISDVVIPKKKEIKVCANCGTTSKEILANAVIGCALCYETFMQILLPMIEKVQDGTHHTGKMPDYSNIKKLSFEEEISRLKKELAVAVREERFEDAVLIKARLNSLLESNE